MPDLDRDSSSRPKQTCKHSDTEVVLKTWQKEE